MIRYGWLHWMGLLVIGGCQAVQPTRPLTIEARDAETQAPIPGAHVRVHPMSGHTPGPDSVTTGEDGIAHLKSNARDERAIGVEATADGYLRADTFIPAQTVRAIEPTPLLAKDKTRQVAFHVDMYGGPRPTVELVVPAGYRGIVKAEIAIARDAASPKGQRLFQYPVGSDGVVRVEGPPLLERVDPTDFCFRFADAAPLSPKAHDSELGFWWLRHEEGWEYFVIGDRTEYSAARDNGEEEGHDESPGPRSSGRANGGGRGGHRRGGGAMGQ